MIDIADILQQIQDAVDITGATVEVKDNDIIITFPDGTTQIFEGAAHLVGSGATVYNDDMGDVIDLLDAQGVIPPVAMSFSVPVIENELSVFEQVVDVAKAEVVDEPVDEPVPEPCVEVPVTPTACETGDCGDIIYDAFYTGVHTWWNTENPFDPIHGPFGTSDNDFIMTHASFARGKDGDDFIVTPHHNTNVVRGGDGDDVIIDFDSDGARLLGGDGDDLIVSLFGWDNTLRGGEGDDTLIAVGDWNTLRGGAGDDTLLSIGDGNTLRGGAGDDILIAKSWGDFLSDGEGGEGGNLLRGGSGDDCLFGADYVSDVLRGGSGNDYLDGGAIYIEYGEDPWDFDEYGADELRGGAGDDTLVAYSGWHIGTLVGEYNGGTGFDRLDLSNADDIFYTWGYDGVSKIEMLDMEDGDADEMWLNPWNVIDMTDNDDELFIIGDEGDKLYLTGGYEDEQSDYRGEEWLKTQEDCLGTDGREYDVYTSADATLYVDTDITVIEQGYQEVY